MITEQSADGSASIGSVAKLSSLLNADVVTPLTAYTQSLAGGGGTAPANSGALATALASVINSALGSAGTATVTDHSTGGNVDLSFSLSLTSTEAFGLAMSPNSNVALTFPSDLQGSATVGVNGFTFETVFAAGAKALTDSTAQVAGATDLLTNFTLSGVAADVTLTAQATIPNGHEIDAGLLTLDTTAPATLNYSGGLHVDFTTGISGTTLSADATAGAAGQTAFLATLADVTTTVDPVLSFSIPVALNATDQTVPGLGAGFTGSIGLTGNVLDGNWSTTVGGTGLSISTLHDFAALSPATIAAEFQSLDKYFSGLAGSDLTNVPIPFTGGTTLGEVINFAQNFQTDVVQKLEPVNDLLGFSEGQRVTAADGSHTAVMTITPTVDLSTNPLPATFSIDLSADGHTATLSLSNQYTDAHGNLHTVSSVNDLVNEINTELAAAASGSTLAALASVVSVLAVSSNTETQGITGNTVTLGGAVTSGDVVQLTVTNSKGLANGPVTLSVTASSTDTLTTITADLAKAINGNATLAAAGITASTSGQTLTVATASGNGTTTLAVPHNAIEISASPTSSDASPASIELTAPGASFSGLVTLATNLGQALGLGSDISQVENFLTGLGFSYDPTLNAIEFNLTYSTSVSLGSNPTETMAVDTSGTTVTVGGAVSPGDSLSVTIENPNIAGDTATISYTVQSGDTLDTVATALVKAINGNNVVSGAGLAAAAGTAPDSITISHIASTDTSAITVTAGTSGAISFAAGFNLGSLASLSGSGDLGITAGIAASMTIGFNLDPLGAQANGVQMTVDGQPLGVATNIFHTPVWSVGTAAQPIAAVTADQLSGATGVPDMQLTLRDGTTGTIEVQHGQIIDTIGGGTPIVITGTGTDTTELNIGGSVSGGETVSVTVNYGAGGAQSEVVHFTTAAGNGTSDVAAGLAAAINGDAVLQNAGVTAGSASNMLALHSGNAAATLSGWTSTGAETFDQRAVTIGDLLTAFDDFKTGNIDVTVSGVPNTGSLSVALGGSTTAGEMVSLVINAPSLQTPVVITRDVLTGDTLASTAQAIAAAINGNATLHTANVTATYTAGDSFVLAGGASVTTNPHSLTLAATAEGNLTIVGTVTPGDVVSIDVTGGGLGQATEVVSYTVQHGDTLASIASGLQAAINVDNKLTVAGITADISAAAPTALVLNGGATASYNGYSSAITADGSGDLTLNATPAAGSVVALSVTPSSGSAQTAAYTVQAGNTADDVIARLADAINIVDPSVSAAVTAVVTGAASISVTNDRFLVDNGGDITLGVTPLPGDVLNLVVNGHALSVTVRAGFSTAEDVIATIVDTINGANLSGVSAALSAQITGATLGTVAAPTEHATFSSAPAIDVTASGTAEAADVLSLSLTPTGTGATPVVASTALADGQSAASGLASLSDTINNLAIAGVTASVMGEVSGAAVSVPSGETDLTATGESIAVSGTASGTISLNVGTSVVHYTVKPFDTANDVIAGLVDAVNAAGIQGVSANVTLVVDGAAAVTPHAATTETVSVTQAPSTGPAIGAGDVMSLTFESTQLSAPISLGYTVAGTDTLATIATNFAAEINANTTLHNAGITASVSTSNPDQMVITGNPSITTNPGSFSLSVSGSGAIVVDGTPGAGDVLAINVTPNGSSTPLSASYVAQSTDSAAEVIAKVADAIGAVDPSVSATIKGTVQGVDTLSVWDNSTNNTADLTVTSSSIVVNAAHAGDQLSLNVNGQEVQYTVVAGHTTAQDVVAGLVDAINNAGISGVGATLSVTVSNAKLSIPSPASEQLTVAPGTGGVAAVYDTSSMEIRVYDGTAPTGTTPASLGFLNGTTGIAQQLSAAPTGAVSSGAYYQAIVIAAPTTTVDYSAANDFLLTLGGLSPVEVSVAANAARATAADFAAAVNTVLAGIAINPTSIGLDPGLTVGLAVGETSGHAGDMVSVDIHNASLTNSLETVTYTVKAGDNAAAIAAGLAAAVNADATLQAAGITGAANGATVSVDTAQGTSTLAGNASSTAETLAASTISFGKLVAAVGQAFTVEGSPTTGNVISLSVNNNGSTSTVSYTVASGDTAATIATALASEIGGISGVTATAKGGTVMYSSPAGHTVAVTDQSAISNSEQVVSSLTFATTMFNEVSASSTHVTQAQAASYGLSISALDTNLAALNGSLLVSTLGFGGTDAGSLSRPVGEIDSGPLYTTTIADRFFFDNTRIVADLTLTLSNLDLQGAIGFIGFGATGHGSLDLMATLASQSSDGNSYVTFHELQNALTDGTLSSFFSFTVAAQTPGQPWAELSIDSIVLTGSNEAGSVIAGLANALVSPGIDITFDNTLSSISDFIHATPHVAVTGFNNIAEMGHLTAADILAGLQTVLQVIDNNTGSQILSAQIPILGVSIGSLLNYAQDFNTFLTNLQNNPAGSVAQLNTVIQTALGSFGKDVTLSYQGGALMLGLTFQDGVSQTLPFSLDLATLAADAGISLPSAITDIVGASGNGDLTVAASAVLGVSVGIQLQAPAATVSTPLSALNNGKGITTNGTSAPDIVIATGGGRQFGVDLDAVQTTATATVDTTAKTLTIGGTATAGETVSVTLDNSTLDHGGTAGAGAVTIAYTVKSTDTAASIANSLDQAINGSDTLTKGGITATVANGIVTLHGASEIAAKVGGNVGELIDTINAAAAAAGAGANFASLGGSGAIVFTDAATAPAPSQTAEALGFTPSVTVSGATTVTAAATGGLTATVANDNVTVSGAEAAGDVVTVTVNGQAAAYTVHTGDTLTSIDQSLAEAINALKLNGVSAALGGQVSASLSGAAETLGGAATAGDSLSLTVHYGGASTETVSYTAVAGDTLATEATGLAAAIGADAALRTAHVTAVATGDSVLVSGGGATLSGTATASGHASETLTSGAAELVAGTAPASLTSGDTIDLVIDGQTVALTVGANAARASAADLATAINQAMASTMVDMGLVNSAKAGTQVALSTIAGAVVEGGGIGFVAADAVLGAHPGLSVASPAPEPLGIEALGFTGATTATDSGGNSTLTATLPGAIDYSKAYEFQLVVNGVDATVSLAADPTRTTDTAFFQALNVALGSTFVDQAAAHLGGSGKALLSSLVQVSETTGGGSQISFIASDSRLGASHSLAIQDIPVTAAATLSVTDINGAGAAESLGFATGVQSVSGTLSAARVLTGAGLADDGNNHRFFIDTTNTGLTLSLGAAVTNLTFNTNIGPLAVSIENGMAVLGSETMVAGAFPAAGDPLFSVSTDVANNPGTLHFGLTDGVTLNEQGDTLAAAGRLYFSEISDVSQEQTVRVGGAVTAGDTMTLAIGNAKLPASETVSYTVVAGDTDASIAAALAAAVNADSTLHNAGITAASATAGQFQVYGAATMTSGTTGVGSKAATENIHIATGYGNLLQVTSNIALQVSLPIYFLGVPLTPVISIEIGNVLGGTSGWALDASPWTLSIPDFSSLVSQIESSFSVFSFLNNPEVVINGLNAVLGTLDTLFTKQAFGYQLPLIGPALADAGDFIGVIRATLIGDLNGLVNDYEAAHGGQQPTTAAIVQSGVDQMIAALGFTGGVTITVDAPDKTINFVLDMSKVLFNGNVNLSANLGIPGLGISVQNGSVGLNLTTAIDLAFQYSQASGFSLMDSMAGAHAVALNFAVTIPQNFSVGLTLGILTLTGTNGQTVFNNADNTTATGTALRGGLFIDLHPKANNDLADLGATTAMIAATDANGTQTVSLTLPGNEDVTAAYDFNVLINGTAVAVSVAADPHRATEADLVAAINTALGHTSIASSVTDPTVSSGSTETLAQLGVSASLNGHTLTLVVADSKLGTGGTLALSDVLIPFSQVSQNVRVEVAANLDLDLMLQATLFGGNMALPSVGTEMLFAYQFDKVLVGTDAKAVSGVIVPFTFENVTLDLGQFLSGFLYPILNSAEKIIQPIMPVLNFITSPLPGISTLLGEPVSLLDLAQFFANGNSVYAKDIQDVINVIKTVDQVATLINTIDTLSSASGGEVKIDFGTYTFGKATVGPLATTSVTGATAAGSAPFDPFAGASLKSYQLNASALSGIAPTTQGNNPTASSALSQLQATESGGGISLPILRSPLSALELLMGQTGNPVTLFQWNLPAVSLAFGFQKEFPIASIGIISLNGIIGVSAAVTVHVAIGYDTYGIQEFVQTHNPVFILDGFYVDDTQGPQLTASVSLTLGVSVSIPIAEVGITATIGGDLSLMLFDPDQDGKVRASEILSELETGNPLNLFVVSGDIYARVDVFVWIGFDINLGILGDIRITLFQWDDTLVDTTLVSFVLTPPTQPILATVASDGTATINMGELSSQRDVGNTSPSDQIFTLTGEGGGVVQIGFDGATQTINASKIIADTGNGNSDITLAHVDVPIMLVGGNGNNVIDAGGANDGVFAFGDGNNVIIGTNAGDTITVGNGNNTIIDGNGNNTITAGGGNNYIAGGSGNDSITVGNGNNVIVGGGGNNTIATGSGNNIVIGGQATSVMTTLTHGGNTFNIYGPDINGVVSNISAISGDGNNTITLGSGNNIVLAGGGAETVTLSGGGDNFILGHLGTVSLAGGGGASALSDWENNGPAAVIALSATTAVGGNVDVNGLMAFGDNVILGGEGNNTLLGGAGTNIILGHDGSVDGPAGGSGGRFSITGTPTASGNSTIDGGPGADVLIGGPGNNIISGGAGADLIAGADATVVRTAAMGASASLLTMTATPDGSTGTDSIDGGTGNNVIMGGGGGADSINGGSGNNILLGDYGTVDASSGTTVVVTGAVDIAGGSDGNDTITAGDGNNLIMGGGGADTLSAGNGNNIFFGDAGSATLAASGYAVIAAGTTTESGGGNDAITVSGSGNNIVFGGIGNNNISVTGTGNNVVLGGLGNLSYSGSTLKVTAHDATSDTNSTSYASSNIISIGAGAAGSNVVMGGAGADTITVAANGNNVVLGDSGTATLTVGTGGSLTPVSVTTLDGATSGEESIGGNDSITITGNGDNVVMGGAGNDTIAVTGTGNNIVLGGLGSVTETSTKVVVASHNAASDTGNANYNDADNITIGAGASGSNVVMGGAGADTISIAASGNNIALGDSGTATLTVGTGGSLTPAFVTTLDSVTGGEESIGGNDSITITGNGDNVVMGGAGNDTIAVTGTGNNVVLGDLGSVTFSSTSVVVESHDAASDTGTSTYASNDTITIGGAGAGSNIVMGGAGADTITVAADGNNVVLGDSGTATLAIGTGGSLTPDFVTTRDTQPGGEESIGGNDSISITGNGSNVVMGGAGNDTIVVIGGGNNVALGDLGSVTFSSTSVVVESHDAASDTGTSTYTSNDTITIGGAGFGSNIVMGGAGADTINVTANGNNFVLGDSGVATITIGTGGAFLVQNIATADTVTGGEESIGGDDTITVTGNGDNVVMGGAGQNTITVDGAGNNIVLGGLGIATLGAQMVVDGHDAASDNGSTSYSTGNIITLGPDASGLNVVMGGVGANLITQNGQGVAEILGHNGQAIFNTWYTAPSLQLLTTVTTTNGGEEAIGGNNTIDINGNGNNVVMGGAGQTAITLAGSGNNALLGHLGQMSPITVGGVSGFDLLGHNTALGNDSTAWNDVILLTATASGNNTIMGGAGNNTITVLGAASYTHSGDNLIFGASGEVTPVLAQTVDEPFGGNDQITIGAAAGGDNVIFGGVGSDVIAILGAGDNSVFGNMGLAVAVNGTTPDLTGRDTAIGGNDTITIGVGANGNNVVMGESGANTITSNGTGLNVLMGHTGQVTHQLIGDRLYPENIQSTDFGIGGDNTISATQGNNVIIGGIGNNTLTGGSGNDYILGHDGNVLFGSAVAMTQTPLTMYSTAFQDGGSDVIDTGGGSENYAIGGTGHSTISGGTGNDALAGGHAVFDWNPDGSRQYFATVDTNPADSSNNTITGNGGNNDILGAQGGFDTLTGGAGSNIIIGHGGQIWYQNNTELQAQTLNVFSVSPDTIIGGGPGHNFLFGGGTQQNFFVANPLSDMIVNTDGEVVLTAKRTGEWSMPPLLGNPVTSMVGNWFPAVIEGTVGGVSMIVANEYYSMPTTINHILAVTMMKSPAPETAATPLVAAGPIVEAPADAVLLGDFGLAGIQGLDSGGHAADAVLIAQDHSPALEFARLTVEDDTGSGTGAEAQAFIFDENSGFWVVDEIGPESITLDLAAGAALPALIDWRDELERVAA